MNDMLRILSLMIIIVLAVAACDKEPKIGVEIPNQVEVCLATTSTVFPQQCSVQCGDNVTILITFDTVQKYDEVHIAFDPYSEGCNTTCEAIQ